MATKTPLSPSFVVLPLPSTKFYERSNPVINTLYFKVLFSLILNIPGVKSASWVKDVSGEKLNSPVMV
mgnify:CR=1 FL=1